jgi:hypothetical protein
MRPRLPIPLTESVLTRGLESLYEQVCDVVDRHSKPRRRPTPIVEKSETVEMEAKTA